MEKVAIQVVLSEGAKLPTYATPNSAGADVYCREAFTLNPGERKLILTGIKMQLPDGYECQVRPRSGLAVKHGITVLNSPGTIDADYRGDCGIILINTSNTPYNFEAGERIAQFVIKRDVVQAEWEVVESLDETERGEGGFGHSGKK